MSTYEKSNDKVYPSKSLLLYNIFIRKLSIISKNMSLYYLVQLYIHLNTYHRHPKQIHVTKSKNTGCLRATCGGRRHAWRVRGDRGPTRYWDVADGESTEPPTIELKSSITFFVSRLGFSAEPCTIRVKELLLLFMKALILDGVFFFGKLKACEVVMLRFTRNRFSFLVYAWILSFMWLLNLN